MSGQNKAMTWIGWILTVLVAFAMLASASMKFVNKDGEITKAFVEQLGYPVEALVPIGIAEAVSALLFLIPQTAALGAVLLTGYLGGATATHVRIGENPGPPVILGMVVWLALWFRDPRARALMPIRASFDVVTGSTLPGPGVIKKILIWVPVTLLLIVAVFAGAAAVQPDNFKVERSATMAASPVDVFNQVNDFHKWEAWSPWAKLDPNAKTTFEGPESGPGAKFSWAGNSDVGEGNMTIVDSKPGEYVKIKLVFLKPMERTNDTLITFKPEGDKTLVTWTMSGQHNFVGKAICMIMNMDKMVGGQFDKGLASMKAIVEAKK